MIYGIDIGGKNLKISKYDFNSNTLSCHTMPLFTDSITKTIKKEIKNPDLVICTETLSAKRSYAPSFKQGFIRLNKDLKQIFGNEKLKYVSYHNKLYSPSQAVKDYWRVVCRNWIGSYFTLIRELELINNGLIIDCGTSSTDIIPVINGINKVLSHDEDNFYNRFKTGEFIWSGLIFTPVSSFAHYLIYKGERYSLNPVAKVYSGDLYLITGDIKINYLRQDAYHLNNGDIKKQVYWKDKISLKNSMDSVRDLIMIDKQFINQKQIGSIAESIISQQRNQLLEKVECVVSRCKDMFNKSIKDIIVIGAAKDIILKRTLKKYNLIDGTIYIRKKLIRSVKNYEPNCETAIGCALIGKQYYAGTFK